MRRTAIISILIIVIAITVAAAMAFIDSSPGQPGGGLAGTSWQLTTINGQPALSGGEPISLSFQQDGQAGGSSGCNSYSGKYVVSGGKLTISDVASTLRACADQALNDQEGAYLQALAAVSAFELAGDQLTLKGADGAALLVFSRA